MVYYKYEKVMKKDSFFLRFYKSKLTACMRTFFIYNLLTNKKKAKNERQTNEVVCLSNQFLFNQDIKSCPHLIEQILTKIIRLTNKFHLCIFFSSSFLFLNKNLKIKIKNNNNNKNSDRAQQNRKKNKTKKKRLPSLLSW